MPKFKRPSAATAIAGIALFATVGGGSAVAATGLIGTNQIRNGAVTHPKLAGNSVWHAQIGSHSVQCGNLLSGIQKGLTACGGKAVQGPAGPAGPKGAPGAPGLSAVLANGPYGAKSITDGASSVGQWPGDNGATLHESWVMCPPGDVALGGGFGPNGDSSVGDNRDIHVTSSAPDQISGGKSVSQGTYYSPISGNPDGAYLPNGWAVQGYNTGTNAQTVRPWVVCAKVG